MLKKSVIRLFLVSVSVVILTACGSSKSTGSTGSYTPAAQLSWPSEAETSRLAPQSEALLAEAHTWLGVPYRYGGNDRKGVDCSGLVLQVYQKALGIALPRNSAEQHEYCSSASKSSLIPGDLIFFATGKNRKKVSHVGIFIGDNLMIHASSSSGVILSDINTPYYTRTYVGSGIVDRYHSMIGDKHIKSKKKPSRPAKKQSLEGPVIPIPMTEATEGFTLSAAESLPVRKDTTATTNNTANTTETASATTVTSGTTTTTTSTANTSTATPIKTVAADTPRQAEPTAEEARASVLNSIKEKDL